MGDESFDRWLEHFGERATLVGWSDDDRKYRLKMYLDKRAFHAHRNLSSDIKKSCGAAVRKRFPPPPLFRH